MIKNFNSDNYAGVHPEVLAAIADANTGHAPAYGDDAITTQLTETLRGHFGQSARVFPVFNGTGANIVALSAITPRWGAVVCVESAHINVDEGGGPEAVAGVKLLTHKSDDGKLTAEMIHASAVNIGNVHAAQPTAVSVSQVTELGTIYSAAELRELAATAHDYGMRFHVDGSRLANAAAALNCSLAALTTDIGADTVSLGGTKNGLLGAEAVIVLNDDIAGADLIRKQHMQLASKMRFFSAQLQAMYGTDLWLRLAAHANAMAQRLADGISALSREFPDSGVALTQTTAANGVFAAMPDYVADRVRAEVDFYDWPIGANARRLMCAFDHSEADVDYLLALLREAITGA